MVGARQMILVFGINLPRLVYCEAKLVLLTEQAKEMSLHYVLNTLVNIPGINIFPRVNKSILEDWLIF